MQRNSRVHLAYLDGLRGCSALYVMLHHIWQFAVIGGRVPRWFSVFSFLKFGSFAVTIFIVLSGYCLTLPVARSPDLTLRDGVAGFVTRRARRILPPYYAALCLAVALLCAFPMLSAPASTQLGVWLPVPTWKDVAAHAVLLHNLSQSTRWTLDPPAWSVALEWQIYFVFALVLVPVLKRTTVPRVVFIGALLGVAPMFFGFEFIRPWYVCSFVLGVAAAMINFSERGRSIRLPIPLGPCAAVCVVVAGVICSLGKDGSTLAPDLILSLGTAAFLVDSTSRLLDGQKSRLLAFLEHGASTKLGEFSYSLYLVHFPLASLMCVLAKGSLALEQTTFFFGMVGLGVPVILLIAYAFHLVFERPFLRSSPASASPSVVPAE
ncbi:MAG TPA: acyltransferase [Polyangiaceae bacterium]|jgi:peptidoglycan/LPS O-acetylase OafA/YrhL|nr:acyltransferase [Polyangiaceae bacterium]